MPHFTIETTQEFNVTYRVKADTPEEAWSRLLNPGFVADCDDQSPSGITGTFEDSCIEEDA